MLTTKNMLTSANRLYWWIFWCELIFNTVFYRKEFDMLIITYYQNKRYGAKSCIVSNEVTANLLKNMCST
jgi:hypothetical protein